MMTKIVNLARKNIFLEIIIKCCCWIALIIISWMDSIRRMLHSMGFAVPKYKKIKSLEKKYEGERCFIICTGPSLTVEDMEKLKGEYTFGMNSISLLYEKTDFRPSFYGCIDEGVFNKLKENIIKYDEASIPVFVSPRISKHVNLLAHWYEIPLNVAYHTYDRWFKNKFWCKFSDDAYKGLYDMYSVTHFLIQVAVYMGFKEIYLLGADCNQVKGKKVHFQDYGVPDTTIDTARERNIVGYEEVKRYADSHDVKIYNATRGGMLEVFERVELEKVLL